MSFFASWLASPPPDAAVEIGADRIAAVVLGSRGSAPVVQSSAVEALPAGAVVPSLTAHNIADTATVAAVLRRTLDKLGGRISRVALVIPDTIARVSLVRFDQIPARRDDLDQLVKWQMRKGAPFPIEEATVTYSPGLAADGGAEFVVELARRDVIHEYESVCTQAGVEAGLIDIVTLSVANLFLASSSNPTGDWLLVHIRPDYTSLMILRNEHVIFFRTRAEGGDETLGDLVHQTAMYYQDRLSGSGFSRVLLGGSARVAGAMTVAKRSLEERLGAVVESIDPTRMATLTDRISATPDMSDALSPLVGILLRSQREVAA